MPRARSTPPARPGRVTLRQIADRAGCSVPAASTVLNRARGTITVCPVLRTRIVRIARELGYRANYHAAALRLGRASTLGLLIGPPADYSFFGAFIAGVNQVALEHDCNLLIVAGATPAQAVARGSEYLQSGRIDALVALVSPVGDALHALDDVHAPIVLYGRRFSSPHPRVQVDLQPGMTAAVEHLAHLGHRALLWVHPVCNGRRSDNDRIGFVRAACARRRMRLVELAVPVAAHDHGSADAYLAAAAACLRGWLATHRPPSAIMAYNERLAAGLSLALWEHGCRIPRDVSIVGVDDFCARMTQPPMTVVGIELQTAGYRAGELALTLAMNVRAGARWRTRTVRVPARLIVRASTAPPRMASADERRSRQQLQPTRR